MMSMFLKCVLLVSLVCLQMGCKPLSPFECEDEKIKDAIIENIKTNLVVNGFVLTQQHINPWDIVLYDVSVKTESRDKPETFYRKCEVSFRMPGVMIPFKKHYEIDKDERGDIMLKPVK